MADPRPMREASRSTLQTERGRANSREAPAVWRQPDEGQRKVRGVLRLSGSPLTLTIRHATFTVTYRHLSLARIGVSSM